MQKWADYLISEVSYDSDHLISVAIRHKDSPEGILEGVPVDKLTIASDIKNGITYITIYSGNKSWKKGHNIQTFSIDGIPYLRIDGNKVKLDNLGDLPNVTSIDIQSLGIVSEDDDTNELKQIENIEKQIQDLESKSLSQLKQTSTSEQISIDQTKVKSRKQQLEEYENEYLNRIKEQQFLLEKIDEDLVDSEAKINSPNIRGSLPKGYALPKPEDKISPEQLAQIEQLEKQIQELESQPEPITEEEPGTTEQLAQVSDLQKQIDELENMLSSKFENLSEVSKSDPNLNKIENEISTNSSYEKENKIINKLDSQKEKLSDIEKKINDLDEDDAS